MSVKLYSTCNTIESFYGIELGSPMETFFHSVTKLKMEGSGFKEKRHCK